MLPELVSLAKDRPKRPKRVSTTFGQTRDVLDYVRAFHKRLSAFYHELSDAAENPRVRMLLDYISQHEKHLQEGLAAYEESAPRSVLDTWEQCTADRSVLERYRDIKTHPDMSLHEVITLAFEIDDSLMGYFSSSTTKPATSAGLIST